MNIVKKGRLDLNTVVFYRERTFIPELKSLLGESDLDLEDIGQSEDFLFSTEEESDLTDFTKYNFNFDVQYLPMIQNLFDYEKTTELFGNHYDFRGLVPQGNSSLTEGGKNHFFGKIEVNTGMNTVHLIEVPEDVWKVEFYGSRLTTNHKIEGKASFIESEYLNPEYKVEEPNLTISFGPNYNTRLNTDFAELKSQDRFKPYLSRYEDLDKLGKVYGNFKEMMEQEYYKLYKEEVKSKKILYIMTSSDELKQDSIDLFTPSFLTSSQKYRNFTDNIITGKEKLKYEIIQEDMGMSFDGRSKTFLGIKRDESCFPLFNRRYKSLPEYSYSRSSHTKRLVIDGKIYETDCEIGGDPLTSPYWICPEEIKQELFTQYYITKTFGGTVEPLGRVHKREGTDLILDINPNPGYSLGELEGVTEFEKVDQGYLIRESGNRINVVFNEPKYNLQFFLDIYNMSPEEGKDPDKTTELKGFGSDVQIIYLDENGEEKTFGGTNNPNLSPSRPFKFKVNYENNYHTDDNCRIYYKEGEVDYILVKDEGGFYTIDATTFSDYTISNQSGIPVYLEVVKNFVTIEIMPEDSDIHVSCPLVVKNLAFNSSFEFKFHSKDRTREIKMKINGEDIKPDGDAQGYTYTISPLKKDKYTIRLEL